MTKIDFKEYICRPYCMFFKYGQKEEMACQGAQVVEALLQNGRIKREDISSFAKNSRLWTVHKRFLEEYVCRRCPFQSEGCDFQSPTPSEDLEPCGGFIVLAFLKENNMIDKNTLGKM